VGFSRTVEFADFGERWANESHPISRRNEAWELLAVFSGLA
jgi:hypothetical protein